MPEIPYINELEAELIKLKENFKVIDEATQNFKEKYEEYSNIDAIIRRNLNILVENTGCGQNVQPVFNPKRIYKIKSPYSSKFWDIAGYGKAETNKKGGNLQLWTMDNGEDRKVKFISAGNGSYFIEFQNGGKVLDVSGGETDRGVNLHIWEKHGKENQKFMVVPVIGKENTYSFINIKSGKAIDAAGGKTGENGTNLHTWDFSADNKAQHWQLVVIEN